MVRRLDIEDEGFAAAFDALVIGNRDDAAAVDTVASEILADVRRRGDAAVIDYTLRFDRIRLMPEEMTISQDEIDLAVSDISGDLLAALDVAASRIEAFHRRQVPDAFDYVDEAGVRLGARWTPIDRVGIYVPGGRAAYPSSLLMNAIPAKVAGVERVVMVVPTPDGVTNPLILAAARRAGVDEIYRIGGAQAIGALALGTETIPKVDKITGPGNAYVAAAKKQVFGEVGIDMIAGPSEILVVADAANDPNLIAMDLLSQAEHDDVAQAILITDDPAFADAVIQAVAGHLEILPKAEIARKSWHDHGAVIVVRHLNKDAPSLIDRLAPEHLELAVDDPAPLAESVRHAGAIFLGRHTPEAIGDYVAGPNHVLPTSRSARFFSGLNVLDFMKRTTFVGCTETSLRAIGPSAVTLAKAEGLDAHALSISLRLDRLAGDTVD